VDNLPTPNYCTLCLPQFPNNNISYIPTGGKTHGRIGILFRVFGLGYNHSMEGEFVATALLKCKLVQLLRTRIWFADYYCKRVLNRNQKEERMGAISLNFQTIFLKPFGKKKKSDSFQKTINNFFFSKQF